jgi:hypothetical protein
MSSAIVVITPGPEAKTSPQTISARVFAESNWPQIISARVTPENSAVEEHITVWLSDEADESADKFEALKQSLKDAHRDAIVSIITNDFPGSCTCLSSPGVTGSAFSVAAAIAVIKMSWGWDESESIYVRVDSVEINVRARYGGNHWVVTTSS